MKLKHVALGAAAVAMTASAAFAAGHKTRGSDGHVNIIYWQAASILNPFLSGSTKDVESASMVIEPLARYDENANMVPWLVEEIPTVENGGVSEDLTQITWKIAPGLKWSDGSAFTSADVKFTYEYCTHPEGGCATSALYLVGAGVVPEERTKILSTGGMITAARETQAATVLVATETGMLHQLEKAAPQVNFEPVNRAAVCKYMKMITPAKLLRSLQTGTDEVTLDRDIADRARRSLEQMPTAN